MPQIELKADTLLMILAVLVILAEVISSLSKGRKSIRELSGRERRSTANSPTSALT